ncbi:unnamed protein product [Rhizophagus irregularis]|nr:unnamed protein product [Rhizophagus irregularis]CAB5377375.1 unnamed protein product [Rhizophagus irregularis]
MSKQPPKRLDNASEKKVDQIEVEQQIQATNNASIQLDDEKSTTTVKRNDAIAINYFENDLKEVAPVSKDWLHNLVNQKNPLCESTGFRKC